MIDYQALKRSGFLKQSNPMLFSLRLKVVGGHVTEGELLAIYRLAERFGQGHVHLTSRQSVEIPGIPYESIEDVKGMMEALGLKPAVIGPGVRTITACQGEQVCGSGLMDTTALAHAIDQRFANFPAPHKFKIGITGCNNNCLKAEENDLGIKGAMVPVLDESVCVFCGACQKVCKTDAIDVQKEAKVIVYIEDQCVNCGKCIKICPKKAWQGAKAYKVYFGGLYGNRIVVGRQLLPVLKDEEQVFGAINTALEFFKAHGKPLERFATTLDRVGWDAFVAKLAENQSVKKESSNGAKLI